MIVLAVAIAIVCQDFFHLIFYVAKALLDRIELGLQPTLLAPQIFSLLRKGQFSPPHSKSSSKISPSSSSPGVGTSTWT